jgi:threonine/homoserine/homoserine lactone efflux protein
MEFILLASAHFLALLSPGPDFFLITQASLRLPRKYGIAICAGIAAANFVYLLFAVFGIEIIKEWTPLMVTMKYLGALYLVTLGAMLLKSPLRPIPMKDSPGFLQGQHLGRQFTVGFLSGILNPKNAIFYLSLFTVMVSSTTTLPVRCAYATWMTSIVFFWDALIVVFIGREKIRTNLGKGIFYIEKISGIMLASFGIILSFT